MKRHVLISYVGTNLDSGAKPDRWNRWRPTVALHQHDDLLIEKTILLHGRRYRKLADQIADDIGLVSPETETESVIFDPQNPWDFQEVYEQLFDFALDRDFDPAADDILLNLTTGTHVFQICAFLLAEARYIPAKLIQSSPGSKKEPVVGTYQIVDLDLSRYDRLAQRFEEERSDAISFLRGGVETKNAAYGEMIDRMEKVAVRSDAPVLLLGPTGAGKSRLARRLYELKKSRHRVEGEFIDLNCATVRGEHALPMLFGQKRGWNGSTAERKGLLKAAHKGVLFLDEIEALGLDDQAMLLEAVESGRFYPLGADRATESQFQLIAGTSADLAKLVSEGHFRADLFARLNLWTFRLPSLAERREDIEVNLNYELTRAMDREGEQMSFAADAKRTYLKFAKDPSSVWSGNFRDLAASATRLVTLSERNRITKSIVENEIETLKSQWRGASQDADEQLVSRFIDDVSSIDRFDLVQLAEVIRVCQASNSMSEAGRKLFSVSRSKRTSSNDTDRVKKYLDRFGLAFGELRS
ncbi:MAG: RNA repair transcriptional activator RtcR [Pseudomonadota bacterium]